MQFFFKHPSYKKIAGNMGIKCLSLKLNSLLIRHVKKCLPYIKDKIQCLMIQKEQELESLGSTMEFEGEGGARAIMLHIVTKFAKKFNAYLEGHFVKESTDELKGGSRIHYIFHTTLFNTIEKLDPLKSLSDEDIRTCIKNCSALSPSLFVEEKAFTILMKQQIARLQEPSL